MELEITRAGTITRSVELSPASLPKSQIAPQRGLIIGGGFSTGIVLSIVFLLISYLVHNKITSIQELGQLADIPILGAIPKYKSFPGHLSSMVISKDSKSSLSEALRTVRTNLDFIHSDKNSKTISITSTVSGEGKTFIAVNLGAIMALSGRKVCVVDIDMRKPKIHLAFEKALQSEGVSTILSGKASVEDNIQKTSIENLKFIGAGPVSPPNPSELLLQPPFSNMLKLLKSQFDVVILDTPPVGLVTDGQLVMKFL